MRRLPVVLLAPLMTVVLTAQDPMRQALPTAEISGRVVDAETDAPVPGALVKVGPRTRLVDRHGQIAVDVSMNVFSDSHRFTLTDENGRFTFKNLAPRMLVIVAEASGYLLSAHGQQGPETPVRQVLIADGQRLTNVDVRAWRSAVITGSVRDEAGEPVVDVRVLALRRTFESGARRFVHAGDAWTDDRGVYRMAGILPGEYLVALETTLVTVPPSTVNLPLSSREMLLGLSPAAARAARPDAGAALGTGHLLTPTGPWLPGSPGIGSLVYPSTFHPAARDAAQASVVKVRSGEEWPGIDLQLMPVQAFRVSGRLTTTEGSPGRAQVVIVAPTAGLLGVDAEIEVAVTQTGDDGSFLFAGVPEGQYVIRAVKESGGSVLVTTPNGRTAIETRSDVEPTLWAEASIQIADTHVADLALPLRSGFRVAGLLVFEGSTPAPEREPDLRASNVRLVASDGRSVELRQRTTIDGNLRFATPRYPPGSYYMAASPIGPWYLKSIVVNGRDALREPIELSTTDLTSAVVTYSDQTYTLFGNVTSGQAVSGDDPGAMLIAFPARYQAWIAGGMNPLFLHTAITYPDGRFRIPRLIPGDYLVAAYDAVAAHDPRDPEFLVKIAPLATRVALTGPDTSGVLVSRIAIR